MIIDNLPKHYKFIAGNKATMGIRLKFARLFVVWCLVTPLAFSSASPCDSFGTCSQKCDLVGGRAQCSCVDGFSLSGNRSCTENDSTWKLIFATRRDVISITYPGKVNSVLSTNTESSPLFVTTDVRNAVVYWSDAQGRRESIYKYPINGATGRKPEIIVDAGIYLPEGVAFDWITGNLYFVDSNLTFIAVCAQNPTKCAVIINDPTQKPRGIALHPNQGIMFWSDWSTNASIRKAGMDGSSPTAIVTTNIVWPNGITVDEANSRIYWVEAMIEKIESSRFDGTDRQIIKGSDHPFGIDIFGDFIFWSDWMTDKITGANKFTGGNETVVITDYSAGRLNGLTVMHIAKQPKIRANPCEDLRCSHVCAYSWHRAQCLCPAGMIKNGNTCVEDETKPKLLLAQKDVLLVMRVNTIGRDVFEQIPLPSQVKNINALVYNPLNDTIIISEGHSRKIIEYSMKTTESTVLVENEIVNVTSMDLDVISENLIWLDVGKGTIEVMSLRTRAKAVVLRNVGNVHDISFAPDRFTLYLSKTGTTGNEEIHKISLGRLSNDTLFYKFTDFTEPAQLTYNKKSGKVVSASGNGTFITVQSETINGKQFNSMRLAGDHVEDVIKIRNQIFWVDQTSEVKVISSDIESRSIFHIIKINFSNTTNNSYSFSRNVLASIHGDIDHLDNLRDNHDCSPKNPNGKKCSHICLAIGINMLGECWCSDDFHLSENGVTCIENDHGQEDERTEKQVVAMTTGVTTTTAISTNRHNNRDGAPTTTRKINDPSSSSSEYSNRQSSKAVLEDEIESAKIEGGNSHKASESSSVGSVVGFVILGLIIIIMGGLIVFLVMYWKKTRSIPLLTKPYFSNQI